MGCCHEYMLGEGDTAFAIESANVVFGRGALAEVGDHAGALGMDRVALFSDPQVVALPHFQKVYDSLLAAGLDVAVYSEVRVEPNEASFLAAAQFAKEGKFTGYVSLGGGSVIDTCKAAILYATYPADFLTYVNAPIGQGIPIPGPLPPHLACPTTCGTGSECTGIAVCEITSHRTKTGISQRRLRPSQAVVDPACADTLPAQVVAASGFDVLCHALESYTALPFTKRKGAPRPSGRPLSQGANPYSDLGCLEALRLCGRYLLRAVADASDAEAREGMTLAASLAGMAFGNAGVHLPHGMGYPLAGRIREYCMAGYPQDHALLPHGVSVVLSAPAVVRFTAEANPQRHLRAAELLLANQRDVHFLKGGAASEIGDLLAQQLLLLMKQTSMPMGLGAVGFGREDIAALSQGALLQRRLLDNAPLPVTDDDLQGLYQAALCYA